MYLIDTDVIGAMRNRYRETPARLFMQRALRRRTPLFISVVTLSDLHRIASLDHKGFGSVCSLTQWLQRVSSERANAILPFDAEAAVLAGRLQAREPAAPLRDVQLAATAVLYDLRMVTAHRKWFARLNVPHLDRGFSW